MKEIDLITRNSKYYVIGLHKLSKVDVVITNHEFFFFFYSDSD